MRKSAQIKRNHIAYVRSSGFRPCRPSSRSQHALLGSAGSQVTRPFAPVVRVALRAINLCFPGEVPEQSEGGAGFLVRAEAQWRPETVSVGLAERHLRETGSGPRGLLEMQR